MTRKNQYILVILLVFSMILQLNLVSAVDFTSTDTFTSDSSSGTDAKTFTGRSLDFTIDSSNIMVACYDWYKSNCEGSNEYQECFAANQQDFDDCAAYSSWLASWGTFTQDSTPETQEMDTSNEANGCFGAKYYKNCDGLGGGNVYSVTDREYWIFSRRWFDCDDGSPSWYTYDAEGYVAPYSYDYNDEIACPANKKCSEDDDGVWVYTYDGTITNPCRWDNGQSCTSDSDCWSNECVHYVCRATDPYCGDDYCDSGETTSNCPDDCCRGDCTGKATEGESDEVCHSSCDTYNSCEFYSGTTRTTCDGNSYNAYQCIDEDTRVYCCLGTPSDCSSNQYCSGGSCLACSTVCDDACQSSACYGTDPDCDQDGNPTLQCANETDLAILDVIPIQVIPDVPMVKGKSGYVRVIVHNYGTLNATGQVNITFDGTPLVPYNPANATSFIVKETNATFDFTFKPEVTGNRLISANVAVIG